MKKRQRIKNETFKKFVFNILGIDYIKNDELFILGWTIDFIVILYAGLRIMNHHYGASMIYAVVGAGGLAGLIWLGKKYGRPKEAAAESETPLGIEKSKIVSVIVSPESLKKLDQHGIDANNIDVFSYVVNALINDPT